jgi:hypothetical protein
VVGLGGACLGAILLGTAAEWAFADDGRTYVHVADGTLREVAPG